MNKRREVTMVAFNRFAAIDFEIADYGRDSACSVSVIVVEKGKIIEKMSAFIRPPRRDFTFSYLHGITWKNVAEKPEFGEFWPRISNLFDGVEFIAAHNASFDREVLHTCCVAAGIAPPDIQYLCTIKLARCLWRLYPTKLSDVCWHLGIALKHHDAESDAMACVKIVLKASERGIPLSAFLDKKEHIGKAKNGIPN